MDYISNERACSKNRKHSMYYVIQVKTGKEEKTMLDIIKNNHSDDPTFEVFSPFRKALRKYKGELKEVIERCFPGYIFVNTNNAEQLWIDLYWTPGFERLLGREGLTNHFVPLDKDESRMIDILYSSENNRVTEISNISVKEGQTIKVLDGPLVGLETQIKKVDLHKRTVKVEFMLCGRLVSANVGINIITDIINK